MEFGEKVCAYFYLLKCERVDDLEDILFLEPGLRDGPRL